MQSKAYRYAKRLSSAALLLASLVPMSAHADGLSKTALFVALQGQPPKAEQQKEDKKDKNIDEMVKDFEKMPGVFPIYRNKKGAADSVMMEVTEDQLGKLYMLQTTAATGLVGTPVSIFHGAPISDTVFHIAKTAEDRLVFMAPDYSERASTNDETRRTMERLIPETVMYTFDIKAKQEDRHSYLIDVTDFFKSGVGDVEPNLVAPLNMGSYGIDRGNSAVDTIKNFPENCVTRVNLRLVWKGNPAMTNAKSVPFAVSYNLMSLPDTGYMPRIADTRIGYFTTNYSEMSDPENYDNNVNYVLRWHLEKKDPSAALSEPVKPIVWYIDNAMPKKYRPAVREGLLLWNKAFEKAGYKNVIVVKEMPDNADWDIADVRYNMVRWTVDMPFAIALFRANPLTGEIVNASINFDAAFAGGGSSTFDTIVAPSSEGTQAPVLNGPMAKYANRLCMLGSEGLASRDFGNLALELLSPSDYGYNKEKLVMQYIKEVASHELGHCLGLRHNFTASTNLDAKGLASADSVSKNGIACSMMEYTPFNIFAIKQKNVDFYSTTVGPYDIWAIQYGYKDVPGNTPVAQRKSLMEIASQTNMPGHQFMTDEMANGFDPYISTFDLGKNPIDWVAKTMGTSRYLLFHLGDRLPRKGESYWQFTRAFNSLSNSYVNSASYATRFIGGSRTSQNYKGDPGERPTIVAVDGATQRRALKLLIDGVFSPNSFAFPSSYYKMLAGNPNSPGSQPNSRAREFPLYSQFSSVQAGMLQNILYSQRLNRIANNEFRMGPKSDTLTMAELFHSLGSSIWAELESGQEISQLRRQLQREHIRILTTMVLDRPAGMPDDAVMLAISQLEGLKGRISKAMPNAKGPYGKPHLQESLIRINKALNAPYINDGR